MRPTPQMVTEPSRTDGSRTVVSLVTQSSISTRKSEDIDTILDLISGDGPPVNISPSKDTYTLLNPKIETLNMQAENSETSSATSNTKFPFLEWQDNDQPEINQEIRNNHLRLNHSDKNNLNIISQSFEEDYGKNV